LGVCLFEFSAALEIVLGEDDAGHIEEELAFKEEDKWPPNVT